MLRSLIPGFLLFASLVMISACEKEETQPTAELINPHTVKHANSIGSPVSSPKGIASDGTNFWIMSGEHNADEHKLTLYDPINQTILEQFTYENLIEVLGTGVYGITWDGENVWISVSGHTNKLVKIDPQNGAVLQTWSSPTTLGPSDLEWDGEKLWISSGTGQIYSMNAANGGSQKHFDNVGQSNRDSGIAIQNGEIWVGNLFNNDVQIYSASNGTYHGVIKNALNSNGQFCFHNGQLAVLSSGGIAFYDVN